MRSTLTDTRGLVRVPTGLGGVSVKSGKYPFILLVFTDVNECQEQGHKACVDTRATCQNTDGSHICKCPWVYVLERVRSRRSKENHIYYHKYIYIYVYIYIEPMGTIWVYIYIYIYINYKLYKYIYFKLLYIIYLYII